MGGAWLHEGTDKMQPVAKFCREHNIPTVVHDNWWGYVLMFRIIY